ncbi:MAG TPA: flagellar hook capping FlgD N-terminal domain-containing protein [Pirellulales bacterium]|jgi:flagellar basal-body rod modification protein FlgD|nr:flagellar hook capping FlgD N-terminal domain-containing protein [Pirellulales bacterium]
MSTASGVNGASSSTGTTGSGTTSALTKITPDQFLQMLIAQLKHQDPLNPTSSDQILQQISQIDNIEATTSLTSSLNSVATDQGFQAASGLIGLQVQGVDSGGNPVSGTVDSASFSNGAASLNVGSQTMPLSGIRTISGPGTTPTTSGG